MIKKAAIAAALFASAVMALADATPAAATTAPASTPMQQRVNSVLAAEPGGVQTAWNEVSWADGTIVLTLAPLALTVEIAAQVSNCASGKFCAYSGLNYGGNKLTYSTCTSDLGVSGLGGSVRSVANSRTSGTVTAYNGSSPVLTVPPGQGKNTLATVTSLSCA